jgi:DNA-binding HxlR family transcriptional regulator
MALRTDFTRDECPVSRSLDLLADPWVLLIVRECLEKPSRYGALRAATGAADNILTNRLERMTKADLLVRVPDPDGRKAQHRYQLTEAGADLLPVINALSMWGERHTESPHAESSSIWHDGCASSTSSADSCSDCGQVLTVDNTLWLRPWRSRVPQKLLGGGDRS